MRSAQNLRSSRDKTSTGEWMYLVGTLIVLDGIPSLVRCIAVASVVPPPPTLSW
jgi:hypothetical protein